MKMIYKKYIQTGVPILLLAVVLFIGAYRLTESPAAWYDEGVLIQVAENIVKYGEQTIQIAPGTLISSGFISSGYPVFYPVAFSLKIFGISLFSARLAMLVFLLAFFLSFYLLVKKMFGLRCAFLSGLLMAGFAPLYGNGKNVLGEVPGVLFLILFLLFLYESERREWKSIFWTAASAIFAGLCIASKSIFIVLVPAIIFGMAVKGKNKKIPFRAIFWFLFLFSISIAFWFLTQFRAEDATGGMLQVYVNPYDTSVSRMLKDIILNFVRFFTEATPIYFAVFFLLWAARLVIAFKKRLCVSLSEKISFIFVLLISLAYLRTPGWYRYFFPAQMITFIYAPCSLLMLVKIIGSSLRRETLLKYAAYFVFTSLIIFQFYQVGFHSWVADFYASKNTAGLQTYFSNFATDGESVFIYNAPEIVPFLKTDNYFQYLRVLPQIVRGADQLPKISAGIPDYIIFENKELQALNFSSEFYTEKDVVAGHTIFQKK